MSTRHLRHGAMAAGATTLLLCGWAMGSGTRQDDPGKALAEAMMAKRMDPNAMQKWMESMKPGLAHELLATFAGEWDVTVRMFMDPAAPPQESKAKSSATLVLDGRFLLEQMKGEFMGMPYEGMGFSGFDNATQMFTSTWCDSINTGISLNHGSIDQTGRIITYVGTMNEPMTGEMGKAVKMVLTRTDEDHHTFEMFEILYGEPFKVFDMQYARLK